MDSFFNKPINQIKEVKEGSLLKFTKPKTAIKQKPEKRLLKKKRLFKGLEKNKQ